jgi:hypothetical protein
VGGAAEQLAGEDQISLRPFMPLAGFLVHDPVQPPTVGNSLQPVFASLLEDKAGAGDESLTVCEIRTSDGPAVDATLAPIETAIPVHLPSTISHSPVCTPARTSIPSFCD